MLPAMNTAVALAAVTSTPLLAVFLMAWARSAEIADIRRSLPRRVFCQNFCHAFLLPLVCPSAWHLITGN
jgi:hypothetical protein